MPDPDDQRKHALECLRLAADAMQLAGDAQDPDQKAHFLRKAAFWTAQAEQPFGADGGSDEPP